MKIVECFLDVAQLEFPTIDELSLAICMISFHVVVDVPILSLNTSFVPNQLKVETRPKFAPIPTCHTVP